MLSIHIEPRWTKFGQDLMLLLMTNLLTNIPLTLDGIYRDCLVIWNLHFELSHLLKRVDNSVMNESIITKQVPCHMPVRFNWIQMFLREIIVMLGSWWTWSVLLCLQKAAAIRESNCSKYGNIYATVLHYFCHHEFISFHVNRRNEYREHNCHMQELYIAELAVYQNNSKTSLKLHENSHTCICYTYINQLVNYFPVKSQFLEIPIFRSFWSYIYSTLTTPASAYPDFPLLKVEARVELQDSSYPAVSPSLVTELIDIVHIEAA